MNKTIGERIRKHREEKGYSQENLAEKLHISRSAYQRIENGETNTWVNHLSSLCEELGISADELLTTDENFVQVNNHNESSNDNGSGVIQNQTNNYNISEKLIEQYEERIKELKDQIEELKEENKLLRSKK